jgi:hypothetical protein
MCLLCCLASDHKYYVAASFNDIGVDIREPDASSQGLQSDRGGHLMFVSTYVPESVCYIRPRYMMHTMVIFLGVSGTRLAPSVCETYPQQGIA